MNDIGSSLSDTTGSGLRNEIGLLGHMLGDTIRQFAGQQAFETVEKLRLIAWHRRRGRAEADEDMRQAIADLDGDRLRVVIRAFTIFLDLLNVVEDRRRVEVLKQRARDAFPGPRGESVRDAISKLRYEGVDAAAIQDLVDRLNVELVFTAHPTDAKRRSVRSKLRTLRELMGKHADGPLPEQRIEIERQMRAELSKLWQTDFIRPWRPSVRQEVERGLSIKPVLWQQIPRIQHELQTALQQNYPKTVTADRPCVTLGSWIGGDRDGHPGVTHDVTKETLLWLRREAIQFHTETCDRLFHSLSLSQRQVKLADELDDAVDQAVEKWPELADRVAALPPGEWCRRWLSIVRWRLDQTASVQLDGAVASGAYSGAHELRKDVDRLAHAVAGTPGEEFVLDEINTWQNQVRTFGFHLACLDVRQNSRNHAAVFDAIMKQAGLSGDPAGLSELERQQLLVETLDQDIELDLDEADDSVRESIELFQTMHTVSQRFGNEALGGYVISMTAAPSDLMTVLWLWTKTAPSPDATHLPELPIVPLFETIDDLRAAPAILTGMFAMEPYRRHVAAQQDKQMIMLGYSDSTKDGGYLSACWSLHEAQQELVEVAAKQGVTLTFFHGRGGSLGRGGGPAARSILSLPSGTFTGALRLTEQGEVLADRYDNPEIAHRHLEQVVWSSLLAAGHPVDRECDQWSESMSELAADSLAAYRELVEQTDFVKYFRSATPIGEIEQLPIGSRPARRKTGGDLSDLRAIPWVFSWTQSRCLLPAWYGLGTALKDQSADPKKLQRLQQMYRSWTFFQAIIDNAELALAKSDMGIAKHYANLCGDDTSLQSIGQMIRDEHQRSIESVLTLTGRTALLDGTPWLKESIRLRNRFIDPLNLIQVELLRRSQQTTETETAEDELRHLTRLSINGVAAGMRTSG